MKVLQLTIKFSVTSPKIFSELKANNPISVKGRCIGYDDLLEEIKLDQCSIVK